MTYNLVVYIFILMISMLNWYFTDVDGCVEILSRRHAPHIFLVSSFSVFVN